MNISPRLDMQLGQKNTLSLRYQFYRADNSNGLGGTTSLPTRATSSNSTSNRSRWTIHRSLAITW